jgi:phosphoenolpyruvate carboxykinase (GTP)
VDTPLGIIPAFEDLNWRGLEKFTREQYQEIVRVDGDAWKDEVASHDELLGKLGARLPRELELRRTQLHQKLAA